MGLQIYKLEKLKIEAFDKPERRGTPIDTFEAMYNPTELDLQLPIKWDKAPVRNSSGRQLKYAYTPPPQLNLTLTLDGTGVDQVGFSASQTISVADRIEKFKKVTVRYDGTIHEPRYLRATWGTNLNFNCRALSLGIKYTLFDRDGSPLRAVLTIVLISDETSAALAKAENKQSPDITHARTVRAGDTLPALTQTIYGSSEHYLLVARFNNLDDFRALTPGQQLQFPPLAQLAVKGAARG